MLGLRFVQDQFHGNLRRISSFDERPSAIFESCVDASLSTWFRARKPGLSVAVVFLELHRRQAVVCILGILSTKEGRNGKSPPTIGTSPAVVIAFYPNQEAHHTGDAIILPRDASTDSSGIAILFTISGPEVSAGAEGQPDAESVKTTRSVRT